MPPTQSRGRAILRPLRNAALPGLRILRSLAAPGGALLPKILAIWLGVLGVAFLAYLPALRVGWVFDDVSNIVDAPSIHWTGFSGEQFAQLLSQTANSRRVVSNLSFALNHMAGGLDPWGYHLVNVLVHLATGLALGWLTTRYLRWGPVRAEGGARVAAAIIPAALFLVHPLNTQAVTYVVQRMTTLAALFCLLAFGAYLEGRRATTGRRSWVWYGAAGGLWGLGLASKENAAILPLVVLTWEGCFGGVPWAKLQAAWTRWSRWRRVAMALLALLVIGVALAAGMRFVGTPEAWLRSLPYRDFTGVERVLTQARVGILYLGLLLWPAPGRLSLDHDFTVSRGFLDPPSTALAIGFWVLALSGVLLLARRHPSFGFPLLAYGECHLIEAGPVSLELVFEHRMYLPMAMLALLPAAALSRLGSRGLRLWGPAAAVAGLVLASWTFARNEVWADPLAFQQDIARKAPDKARPQSLYAQALKDAGRIDEAIKVAERAVALAPTEPRALVFLGEIYREARRPEDALAALRRAAALAPLDFEAGLRIGEVLEDLGRADDAVAHYLDAGVRFARAGLVFQAIPVFERAVELDPGSAVAHNHLGNAYALSNRAGAALEQYQEAVRLDSTNVEALYNLAHALELEGRMAEAIPYYRRFVEMAPERLAGVVDKVREKLARPESDSSAAGRPALR